MASPPFVCLMDDNKTTRHRVPCGVCEACARNQDWQRGFDAARQYVHTATEIVAECEADLAALREKLAVAVACLKDIEEQGNDSQHSATTARECLVKLGVE